MTKPNDGTISADREPEGSTGTQEISWQSAMDAQPGTASETDSGNTAEAPASPEEKSTGEKPTESAGAGTVDFVLAEPPAADAGKDGGQKSAFGEKAKDADVLWASLGSGSSAKSGAGKSKPGKDHADTAAAKAPDEAPDEKADEAALDEDAEYAFDSEDGVPADTPADEGEAAKSGVQDKGKKQAKPRAQASGPFGGKSFGPVMQSVPMTCDEDGKLVPTPATMTSRLFTLLALIPIILPVALFLIQVVFTLDTRALWYSDEVRYASAYRSMVDSADWLVLHLNGALYPDKPPLFFWFLYGLEEAAKALAPLLPFSFTLTDTMLFFSGVAISGLLCLLATHALASMVGRVDRRTVLAADLILLSGFFFAGLAHYLRMDLLFTACITFSHVFLFHAWVREKAPLLMVLGFLFAGAAVLVKGPLGLAFPVLAGVCFLIWQGRFLRFFRLDSIFGLIVGLAVPGVWLALAWLNTGDAFLNNILHKQILARALDTWHHAEPWYHYLMTFPLIWLPWTLVLLFLPWGRFMGKGMRDGIKASRTKDGAGLAYLWCAFLPGFILLSVVSIKIPIYCLPLFPPLAVLCARAVLRMRPAASAWLQYSLALVLALLGLALVLLPAAPAGSLPLPYVPRGVMVLGGICLLFACMLAFLVRTRRSEGSVLLVAFFTTALAYPMWTVTAPSLDTFLSPKAQAEVIKEYRAAGYVPATFNIYGGTYTYYAGNMRDCPNWEDALAMADQNPKTILALRASFWDKLEDKPEGFAEVNRQKIAERDYVLVARPPMGGQKPVSAEVKTEAFGQDVSGAETARPAPPSAASEAAPADLPDNAAPGADTGETASEPAAPTAPETAAEAAPETPAETPLEAPGETNDTPATDATPKAAQTGDTPAS